MGRHLPLLAYRCGDTIAGEPAAKFSQLFCQSVDLDAAITLAFLHIRVPVGLMFGLVIGVLAMFHFGAALGITASEQPDGLKQYLVEPQRAGDRSRDRPADRKWRCPSAHWQLYGVESSVDFDFAAGRSKSGWTFRGRCCGAHCWLD